MSETPLNETELDILVRYLLASLDNKEVSDAVDAGDIVRAVELARELDKDSCGNIVMKLVAHW